MSKKTILWLALISDILVVIGLVVYLPSVFSAVQSAQSCSAEQLSAGTCTPNVAASVGAGFLIGILLFILAGIPGLIAWIGALIRSAKMQTWGWFVVVLIIGGLGTLIYALAGPPDRPPMVAARRRSTAARRKRGRR